MSQGLGNLADPVAAGRALGLFEVPATTLARLAGAVTLLRTTLAGERAPVAPTPYEVLAGLGCSRLLHYAPRGIRRFQEPVLLVPSLINRPYILDLMEGVSLVQALLDAGFEAYLVDWGDPGEEEVEAGFATYVGERLPAFLEATCRHAGAERAHLLGQCLGGTMTAALAAVDDTHIASLVHLTAPMTFHDDGMLSAWSRAPFFDAAAFALAFGNIPTWITQPSFVVLRPLGQAAKVLRLYQNLGDPRFLTFFRCLETWINDNVSIPRAFYVDLIERLYRRDGLYRGELKIGGKQVRLEDVRVPVLTIAASEDHIVPPESALAGHPRFASADKEAVTIRGGHIGVVVGGRGRRELWRRTTQFFQARSTALGGETEAEEAEG
ncbi:MAG: alpha/beta fold hydrolase [Deltaproteobacteria bacterium]|nr:MAG: alpha/beta fold hydrolase [Deltaproteobacteria bacterium]